MYNFLPFLKCCHQVGHLIIPNNFLIHKIRTMLILAVILNILIWMMTRMILMINIIDHVNIDDDDVNEVDRHDVNIKVHPFSSLLHWLQVKSVHHWKLKYFSEATIMQKRNNIFQNCISPRNQQFFQIRWRNNYSMRATIVFEKKQQVSDWLTENTWKWVQVQVFHNCNLNSSATDAKFQKCQEKVGALFWGELKISAIVLPFLQPSLDYNEQKQIMTTT